MAEDALQAEDVATVREERPGKRVAQDVGRTARLQSRAASKPVYQLIEPPRGQSVSARTREERIVVADTASMAQPDSEGLRARPMARVLGCLLTTYTEMEGDAAAAAREKVAVVHESAAAALFEALADRLLEYQTLLGCWFSRGARAGPFRGRTSPPIDRMASSAPVSIRGSSDSAVRCRRRFPGLGSRRPREGVARADSHY